MEKVETKSVDREWNYYFEKGSEVMLDGYDYNMGDPFSCYAFKDIFDRFFHKAIVKNCYSDMHFCGKGSMYVCEIEFQDGFKISIPASYLINYCQ